MWRTVNFELGSLYSVVCTETSKHSILTWGYVLLVKKKQYCVSFMDIVFI